MPTIREIAADPTNLTTYEKARQAALALDYKLPRGKGQTFVATATQAAKIVKKAQEMSDARKAVRAAGPKPQPTVE
jgi:hypothetical protein